jgi:predicted GNAT family acetyltransferase
MLYYFLIETINKVYRGEITFYNFFNVINETGERLVLLLVKDFCLVYGNNFDKGMIFKLSEEMEFKKFKRYEFAGNKNVIDALFKLNAAEYEMQKHRIIYKCKQVKSDFTYSSGEMQMGDLNRIDELANFSVGFNEDYFGNKVDLEYMKEVVFNGIMNDNIYQWNYNNNICSIAQAIHGDYDFPVIGHFYTNPAFRNQGFGASLVHKLTKGLLNVGHEFCMLSTDASNPASNKVFIKVGYESTGEYLLAYKERF